MKKIRVLLVVFVNIIIYSHNFNELWFNSQQIYKELSQAFEREQQLYNQSLIDPGWIAAQKRFEQLIMGSPNQNFLKQQVFLDFMLRTYILRNESDFISDFLSESNKILVSKFSDNSIGGVNLLQNEYNCSASSLYHLYVFSRIVDQKDFNSIKSVLEWGGGFGNLTHVVKKILPEVTYYIVDLLPLLTIQHLYLSLVLPDVPLKVHFNVTDTFEKGYIHLIPVYLVEKLNIKVDAMISAFALTESSYDSQKIVCEKKFFDASIVYLSGIARGLYTIDKTSTNQIHNSMLKKYMDPIFNQFVIVPHYAAEQHFELLVKK